MTSRGRGRERGKEELELRGKEELQHKENEEPTRKEAGASRRRNLDKEKEEVDEEISNLCKGCHFKVRDNDCGLFCDLCEGWYHAGCAGVSQNLYKMLEKDDEIWICKHCKGTLKGKMKKINRLEEENKQYKEANATLVDELEDWKNKFQAMKGEIVDEVAAKVEAIFNQRIKVEVEERVTEVMREREEKEKKKNNLVIYNLEESDAEDKQEREREDQLKCVNLFTEIRCENIRVRETVRLGKMTEGRKRPLLLKLENENSKYEVLRRAKFLKNTRELWAKRVIITKDQTEKEREETKKALVLLKERRDRGEQGWYVRDGKLLRFKRFSE